MNTNRNNCIFKYNMQTKYEYIYLLHAVVAYKYKDL